MPTTPTTPTANSPLSLLAQLGLGPDNPGASSGTWLPPPAGTDAAAAPPPLVSTNPTTGEPLASVRVADGAAYEQVMTAAQARFAEWRLRPAPARGEVVRRLGELLRRHKEPLGELIALEVGKLRAEGLGEVQEMIDICDFAVGLSRQLYGLTLASERPQHRMYEQWQPLGPVAIITAFNFPMAVWSWNAAIAAVCGDTCLWKPSPLAPLSSLAVQHLCHQVMRECDAAGLWNLLVGGADLGQRMAADARLPLVSFTGSVAVGQQVAVTVAARLGRSLLELGGNNAVIVLDDADVELAVRGITFAAVGTAGQRCTTTRRLFLQEGIADRVIARLVAAYKSVRIGDPQKAGTLMGPLINAAAVGRYQAALAAAVDQGGRILCGGRVLPGPGHFVEPTLVAAPAGRPLPIADEETFAPILYIFRVVDLAQGVAAQNAVAQGLSSAIFTDSVRAAERFLSAAGSDCGIANVNIGTSGAEIGGAFGGEKATGGGREAGSDSWKAYMRRQTCTINWGKALPLSQGIEWGSESAIAPGITEGIATGAGTC